MRDSAHLWKSLTAAPPCIMHVCLGNTALLNKANSSTSMRTDLYLACLLQGSLYNLSEKPEQEEQGSRRTLTLLGGLKQCSGKRGQIGTSCNNTVHQAYIVNSRASSTKRLSQRIQARPARLRIQQEKKGKTLNVNKTRDDKAQGYRTARINRQGRQDLDLQVRAGPASQSRTCNDGSICK